MNEEKKKTWICITPRSTFFFFWNRKCTLSLLSRHLHAYEKNVEAIELELIQRRILFFSLTLSPFLCNIYFLGTQSVNFVAWYRMHVYLDIGIVFGWKVKKLVTWATKTHSTTDWDCNFEGTNLKFYFNCFLSPIIFFFLVFFECNMCTYYEFYEVYMNRIICGRLRMMTSSWSFAAWALFKLKYWQKFEREIYSYWLRRLIFTALQKAK